MLGSLSVLARADEPRPSLQATDPSATVGSHRICSDLASAIQEYSDKAATLAKKLQASAAVAAVQGRRTRRRSPQITCARKKSPVAAIIAADIRLPPEVLSDEWRSTIAFRHRGGGVDGCNRTRSEVMSALNHFTTGSDLFIHTDQAYADDLTLFENVAAMRFSEDDGGNSDTANTGNRGGTTVQWWRLKMAWNLLVEYENACDHRYEFVMKLRTDMNLFGRRTLSDLYTTRIKPHYPPSTAFLSSDRFFGGSRPVMQHMASFGEMWPTYSKAGVAGVCGTCDNLGDIYHRAKVTPEAVEVALTDKRAECRDGCFTAQTLLHDNPQAIAKERVCTVYDRERIEKRNRHKRGTHDSAPDRVAEFRSGADHFACMHGTGSSEKTFVYHVILANFPVSSFAELDAELWADQHAELMVWRHMVHVFADGYTVEDGPLQSFGDFRNALTWAITEQSALEHGDVLSCLNSTRLEDDSFDGMYLIDRRTTRFLDEMKGAS